MTGMAGPDCAVMCNSINTHTHTHARTHTLTERPMASALFEELYVVRHRSQETLNRGYRGSSRAALAAEENPQGRGIGIIMVEAGAGRGRGGRGGGG